MPQNASGMRSKAPLSVPPASAACVALSCRVTCLVA